MSIHIWSGFGAVNVHEASHHRSLDVCASDSPPKLSADPVAELAALIARELELHEEGLAVTSRIKELHGQLAQQREAALDDSDQPPR
jgi:hypothetical protein